MPAASRPTPAAEIVVDGAPVEQKYMTQLLDVQVRDNVLLPDTAVVRLRDPLGEFIDTHPFKPGAEIEIRLGAIGDRVVTPVFKGEIVALEPEFTESGCVIAARAYDKGHRLNRHRRSKTFQDVTAADMVRTVASGAGLSVGELENTRARHKFFQQSMETDWEFCWRLAAMNDLEFLVDGSTFHFRRRKPAAPVLTLKWGQNLRTFKPRLSGAGQVATVSVSNLDPETNQEFSARATEPVLAVQAGVVDGRGALVAKLNGGEVTVADQVVTSGDEASDLAQSTLDRLSSSFLEADGKAEGNPLLGAGDTVEVTGVAGFSGKYVLSQTTHVIGAGGSYVTHFSVSGRTSRTFGDLVARNGERDWADSLVLATVTNNNDPEGFGRVRVAFPALGSQMEGWWARVLTLNAGTERGIFMMPQVGDHVVVGFEHGDARRPFVLGSLYTGREKLPADLHDDKDRKAAFGVKSDHKVHVEGKQAMTLRTGEKLVIEVNRDGQGGTGDSLLDAKGNIEEKAAQSIKVSAGTTIEIDAKQSVKIKGAAGVTIEATQGPLKLSGAMVDIQATGVVNVKGSVINLG